MRLSFPAHRTLAAAALTALLAAPAAAACWSGGQYGKGVPRESLLVSNQAPFAVNVLAGPIQGVRRVLGKVPPQTTMRFPAVLAPGRNEALVWVDVDDVAKHKLTAARVRGTIAIVDRRNATCRRSAQLTITAAVFDTSRARKPGDLAPGAGKPNDPKPSGATR